MHKQLLVLFAMAQFSNPAIAGGSQYSNNSQNKPLTDDREYPRGVAPFVEAVPLIRWSDGSETVPGSATAAPNEQQVYQELFADATKDLQLAEQLMRLKDFSGALRVAKSSLDAVRVKVGINPKAKLQEKVPLKFVTLLDFGSIEALSVSYANYSLKVRDGIAKTLAEKHNGYYLDFLNLMKRTNLIYIRAFTGTLKADSKNGQLLKRDLDKIQNDIFEISAIPLYLSETDSGKMIMVFDFEVTSSDQNYLFNRELFVFMLENQELFGAKTETEADNLIVKKVNSLRKEFKTDLEKMTIDWKKIDISEVGVENVCRRAFLGQIGGGYIAHSKRWAPRQDGKIQYVGEYFGNLFNEFATTTKQAEYICSYIAKDMLKFESHRLSFQSCVNRDSKQSTNNEGQVIASSTENVISCALQSLPVGKEDSPTGSVCVPTMTKNPNSSIYICDRRKTQSDLSSMDAINNLGILLNDIRSAFYQENINFNKVRGLYNMIGVPLSQVE